MLIVLIWAPAPCRLLLAIAFGGVLGVLLGLLVALDAATTHQQSPRTLVAAVVFLAALDPGRIPEATAHDRGHPT